MQRRRIQPGSLPAFRFLLGFLLGVIVAGFIPPLWTWIFLGIGVVSAALSFWRHHYGLAFWGSALSCGCAVALQLPPISPMTGWYPSVPATIKGTVRTILRANTQQLRCIVDGQLFPQGGKPVSGSVLVTIWKADSITGVIAPGAKLYGSGFLRPPRPPQLFTDFDEIHYARAYRFHWYAEAEGNRVSAVAEQQPIVWQWRRAIQQQIFRLFDSTAAPVVVALLTGDKSWLPYAQRRLYQTTGVAHVFAVSGFHVGIIAVVLFALLSFLRGSWWFPVLFTVALGMFTAVTGAQPSTVRASLMASLFVWLLYLERPASLLNVVAFAAIVIALAEPAELLRVSFQLSFAAVFGIALLYPVFLDQFRQWHWVPASGRRIAVPLAVSLAASFATAPVVAYYFHQFSWIAPIVNVFTLPLLSLVIIFALCALGMSVLSLSLAQLYSATASMLLSLAHSLLAGISRLPVTVEGDTAFQIAVGTVLAFTLLLLFPSFRTLAGALIAMGILLALSLRVPAVTIIAARDQMIVAHNSQQRWLLLQDRRPLQPFHLDLGLARYLSLLSDSTTVYAGGPIAMAHLRFVPVASVDTVLVPTFVFPSGVFWQAVDSIDSWRIPLHRVRDSVWRCDSVVQYAIAHNRLEFHGKRIDTAIVLPQLQRGALLILPSP